MFGKNVMIKYKGILFNVFVICTPDTPEKILKDMAKNKLIKAFDTYSIEIVEK